MPWTAFVADRDLERLSGYHRNRRLNPGTAPRTYEFRLVDRHGTPKDVYMTVGLIPGTDRSVASMVDVSDRKRFEEELRAAHEQMAAAFEEAKASQESLAAQCCEMENYQATLQGIIDFLPDPTFVLDRAGTVTIWNRAIEKVTGIRKSQIIGLGAGAVSGRVPGFCSPLLAESVLSRKGESIAREIHIPSPNGGEGTCLWGKASPLYDARGRLSGAIESLRDVTELKRMEAQIRHRIDLEQVVSSISARFVALDPDDLDDALNETIQALGSFWGRPELHLPLQQRPRPMITPTSGARRSRAADAHLRGSRPQAPWGWRRLRPIGQSASRSWMTCRQRPAEREFLQNAGSCR